MKKFILKKVCNCRGPVALTVLLFSLVCAPGFSRAGDGRIKKPSSTGSNHFADPITGKVLGADGTALAGISVTVKGSKRGTSTSAAGTFSIQANKGDVL